MAKYSIILPVRNGGEYVKDCVASILSQTNPDFNLHVLDNCSTDGTVDWVASLKDERIKLILSNRPLSIEESWARITSIGKNEFMTLIGHDDLLDASYLASIDGLVARHPNASLYETHFRYIGPSGKTIRACKPMDEVQQASEFLAAFLAGITDTMGTGFTMRAADYDEVGGIPAYPNLLFADFELWIRLARKGYKATCSDECFSFRLHQSMTSVSPDNKLHQAFEQFIKYLSGIKHEDERMKAVIERYSIAFIEFYCKSLSHRLLRTPRQGRSGSTVSSFLDSCKRYADLLVPGNHYDPGARFSIKLAKQIDSNFLTRSLFLMFKRIRSKPVLE